MTTSFSWASTGPQPDPPTAYQWGGPVPDGYEWPPAQMRPGAFLVCGECGAAVPPGGVAVRRHDAWHGR